MPGIVKNRSWWLFFPCLLVMAACSKKCYVEKGRDFPGYSPPVRIALNQTDTMTLIAKDFYSRKSVAVKKGEVYSFTVLETCEYKDATICATPNGCFNILLIMFPWAKRVRKEPCFKLCASINTCENNLFAVGCVLERKRIDTTGNLHFFANDAKGFYGNNKGTILLEVRRDE